MNKKNNSNHLRSFSWSNKNRTKGQTMIEKTVLEWYDAKHQRPSNYEIDFINENTPNECPFCGSKSFAKNGFSETGLQRFKCNKCNKRFNVLTGTIFESRKISISEWIEYLLHLFEFHSIKSTAFDNRNAITTGQYWINKVFLVLKNIQNSICLDGTVYIDETFFSVSKSDKIKVNGKELRGISPNKICVVTGTNNVNSFFFATDVSKLSEKSALKYYGLHISNGSFLIHDYEKSHNVLVQMKNLSQERYDASIIKQLDDSENPLKSINELHRLLKMFMRAHSSYSREDLQDWLNLFWFITNGPKDKYDKVLLFIQRALSLKKTLKYREFFKKNAKF